MKGIFPTLFAAIIVIVLCMSAAGQRRSDREVANLRGLVRTVTEIHESGPRSGADELTKYDRQGNEIERLLVSDFGERIGTEQRSFDAAGKLLRSVFVHPDGTKAEETRFKYHGEQLIEVGRYDNGDVLREKTVFVYGPNGKVAEERYFDPDIERAKTVFKYDDKGNAVEMAFFLIDGRRATAPVGPCLGGHRVAFRYDSSGRAIARSVFEVDDREKKSWSFSYDRYGNYLVHTVRSGSSMTKTTYTYEYDLHGNWVKRTAETETDDGLLESMLKATGKQPTPDELSEMKKAAKRTAVIRREITYY